MFVLQKDPATLRLVLWWIESPSAVKRTESKCVRTNVLNYGLFFGAVIFAAGCFMADGKVQSQPKPPRVIIIHVR
jgi:hypothetical protein